MVRLTRRTALAGAGLALSGCQVVAQPAPEIARTGLRWFNVAGPVPLASLLGRVVVLDFWTEGCINCIHIVPTLRAAEQRFGDKLAVIGVHSPKFANEKDPASVADAIQRYGIRNAVVNDPDMGIWRDYGGRGWPTLVLIDASGAIAGRIVMAASPILS